MMDEAWTEVVYTLARMMARNDREDLLGTWERAAKLLWAAAERLEVEENLREVALAFELAETAREG